MRMSLCAPRKTQLATMDRRGRRTLDRISSAHMKSHALFRSLRQNDYHVRELYNNGSWRGNDLTAGIHGPAAFPATLTSFFDGSIEHVFYVSWGDQHVRELYSSFSPLIRTSD